MKHGDLAEGRRRRSAAGLGICTLLVGACGGQTHSAPASDSPTPLTRVQYERTFRQVGALVTRKARGLETRGADAPGQTELIRRQSLLLREEADRLARLLPPPEVAEAHRLFVGSLRSLAATFRAAAAALRRDDEPTARRLLTAVRGSRAERANVRAKRIFAAKGYRIGNAAAANGAP